MAIIISDDFNRANSATLGTAPTGQTWTQTGSFWGISSNTALFTWDGLTYGDADQVLIDSGFSDAITSVVLVNPVYPTLPHFANGIGLICRYVSDNYYWRLLYYQFPGSPGELRLQRIYAGSGTTAIDVVIDPAFGPNTKIAVACCGTNFEIFVNDVSQGTYDDSTNPQNYGTQCGLINDPGGVFFSYSQAFDDFLVTTNGTCTPTYNCTGSACVDPGDGSGTYATLAACLSGCAVAASYNCIDGQCVDPGDGTGTYSTLQACVNSGCGGGSVVVETVRFDAGTGSGYYYVAPVVDSGDELRSKTVKSFRATGKFTNAAGEIYGYDVSDVVSTSDLEQGLNSDTGQLAITDTSGVAQTPREQVNVPNAVLHTVRVLGDDTGETDRDRIDEIVTEQSEIGVRR